jgi:acetolactate synthase I/II/III large subunit
MRVVDAIAAWMDKAGIEAYFGYYGGALWPMMDALVDYPHIKGYQAKHESHAVHMADVYWRTTGKIAPVIVTKGPGLMNCVGGIASAMHDTAPILLIGGAGSTHLLGKGGMQEMYYKGFEDAVGVFRPITKGSWSLVRPDTAIDVFNQAYKTAMSGRPGPVFVQVPFDIQQGSVEGDVEPPVIRSVGSRLRADAASIETTLDLLAAAEKPVIVAGGGVKFSPGGADALRELAETLDIPVVTSLTAKGVLSEHHRLSLGPVGRSGTDSAAEATRDADLVIAIGARFSDNHTSNWRKGYIYDFPRTRLVHVDVDPSELGRNYPVDVAAVSDAATFLRDVLDGWESRGLKPTWQDWVASTGARHAEWRESIRAVTEAPTDPIHPGRMCAEIGEVMGETGQVFVDVGDVIQYAEPYMTITSGDQWHINAGMAEMGWASSGVLGAVVADRTRPAIALTGDGAFNMVSNVLASAVEYDLPGIWVILNNNELGIERKGSLRMHNRLHPWSTFVRADTGEPYNPDYVKLAEANGARGELVEKAADFAPALRRAIESGRPTVIDVRIDTSVPTYFTSGIDRAYPAVWEESYPLHSSQTLAERDTTGS